MIEKVSIEESWLMEHGSPGQGMCAAVSSERHRRAAVPCSSLQEGPASLSLDEREAWAFFKR